jgi:hypothetical protein
MMPRDKLVLAVQGIIIVYVLYQVTSTVYNHLKAKDRLKRKLIFIYFRFQLNIFLDFVLVIKLFYKDNVD